VSFQVHTAASIKMTAFLDIAECILVVSELRTDSIIREILTLVIRGHWKEIEFEIRALDDGQNLETQ
jgi:hypothetical protein